MGSVQSSEEWGQRAKIVIPKVDVELGSIRGKEGVNIVASFCDDDVASGDGPKTVLTTIGRYED